MYRRRGFTLLEMVILVLFVVLFVFIVVGVLVPLLSKPRRNRGWNNSSCLTCMAKSLDRWSDEFYPSTQDFPKAGLPPAPAMPTYTIASNAPTDRITALCNMGSDPLSPTLLLNPVSTDIAATGTVPTIVLRGNNLSYAVLDALNFEWKNGTNAAAPLAADKQVGKGSFWNTKYWEGSVVWGDTHTTYETSKDWPTTTVNGHITVHDDLFAGTTGPSATGAMLFNP